MGKIKDSMIVIELTEQQLSMILQAIDDREQFLTDLLESDKIDEYHYAQELEVCRNTYNIIEEYSRVHDTGGGI